MEDAKNQKKAQGSPAVSLTPSLASKALIVSLLRTSAPRKGTEITSVLLLHRLLRAGLSAIRLLLSKRLLSLLSERRPRGL